MLNKIMFVLASLNALLSLYNWSIDYVPLIPLWLTVAILWTFVAFVYFEKPD